MHDYNLRLFMRLCMDLDIRYQRDHINLDALLMVRSALLSAVESDTTSAWESLWSKVQTEFQINNWHREYALKCGHPTNIAFVRAVYFASSFLLKVEKEVDKTQIANYVERFKTTEKEVAEGTWRHSHALSSVHYIINRLLSGLRLDHATCATHYCDGPGAVYERLDSVRKKCEFSSYRIMDYYYPVDGHWFNNVSLLIDDFRVSNDLMPCRLTLVPKDFRGPRGVFIHPRVAMRTQQGQRRQLEKALEWCPSIDLRDQTRNQEFAHIGSFNRTYATLDLSDASDRIHKGLIAYLFRGTHWPYLASTRAVYCELPIGPRHRLQMFAPMGSALCFPLQTALFTSIVVAAVYYHTTGSRVCKDWSLVQSIMRRVRVFGDDICCPSEAFSQVVSDLESFGLRVNRNKSFVHGFFRESCGYDSYHGVDITPPRLRVNLNKKRMNANDFASLVQFANRLRLKFGLVQTTEYMVSLIQERWPAVGRSTRVDLNPYCLYEGFGDKVPSNRNLAVRLSPEHNIEHHVLSVRTRSERSGVDDRYLYNDRMFARSQDRDEYARVTNRYAHPRLFFRRVWQALGA